MSISSASTSSLQSVADLGAPDAAADRTLRQYLEELKTTRLGVRRESDIISASSRTGSDGKEYYDIEVCSLCHPGCVLHCSCARPATACG